MTLRLAQRMEILSAHGNLSAYENLSAYGNNGNLCTYFLSFTLHSRNSGTFCPYSSAKHGKSAFVSSSVTISGKKFLYFP